MPDDLNIIKVPRTTFAVGDRNRVVLHMLRGKDVRPIYGPEKPGGGRELVGVIEADSVAMLTDLLDYADTNMPTDPDA